MTHGRILIALLVFPIMAAPAGAALQDCTTSDPGLFQNENMCPCPFDGAPLPGGGTVSCAESSFKCIPPDDCGFNEIDLNCVTRCDEIRGCNELCCNSVDPTCSAPSCDSMTCSTDPAECESCVPPDIINPCTLAAQFEGASPTVECPGSGAPGALPLVGQPSRDPFSFGIFGLIQVKAEDVHFHRDTNAATGQLGPACNLGTNCNTTNTSSPYGTVNLNQAVFPAGSQIVTGKVRYRSKPEQNPALAADVFANDAVFEGGDKACTVNDGRQLWCPGPLLRNRYLQCPAVGSQSACDDPNGPEFCFCDDPCHLEAHVDEIVGVPNAVFALEPFVASACLGNCASVTVTTSDPQPTLLAPGCYSTVTVKHGATLSLDDGGYVICQLKLEGGSSSSRARVVTDDTAWSGGNIHIFLDRLTIGSWGEFLWQDSFWWDPADPDAPIAPSEVRVAAYSSTDAGISLAQDSKAHGTLIAMRSDVNLGTRSSIRGRIFAGKKAVGTPDDVYCGCRGAGAECDVANDCCSLTCTDGFCTDPS
jgi:hypothetical protein